MIVHWGDDGLLIVFCRDGPRDDGEEGGRPQTDQCSGLQVQRTGPLTAGWGWWPRVIVYSVLFRNCMWIYSAVMSHIRFISLLADCNPLISYTCISEVAFEVRSSLFNCYMVVIWLYKRVDLLTVDSPSVGRYIQQWGERQSGPIPVHSTVQCVPIPQKPQVNSESLRGLVIICVCHRAWLS